MFVEQSGEMTVQKEVKIKILGVLDSASKTIRLKVINPGNNQGVTYLNFLILCAYFMSLSGCTNVVVGVA